MEELSPRLRAVCDLSVAEVREYGGRHEYDGEIQDLSPDGVRSGLARLERARADSGSLDDRHDEAHLTAFENLSRVGFGELRLHRRNPLLHLSEFDLASYDRDYAPAPQRDRGPPGAPGRVAAGGRQRDRRARSRSAGRWPRRC